VPEVAAREHLRAIDPITDTALRDAGITLREVDAVGATVGPGLIGCLLGARHELEYVVLGSVAEVLDPAPLTRASPEVVVDRVRSDFGSALDRDPVLARVRGLLLAAHPPAAHGGDQLELRRQRHDRRLDPHLVIALPRAPMGDRVAARGARVVHGQLGDQRPPERREQRIAETVDGVGLDRREHVLGGELLACVDDVTLDGAEL